LLGSLPITEPQRLLNFNDEADSFSYPDYLDYRDQSKDVFEGVSAHFPVVPASLGGRGEPERIRGQLVTENYFAVVGARLALGRAKVGLGCRGYAAQARCEPQSGAGRGECHQEAPRFHL